jgi:hypothetical protein
MTSWKMDVASLHEYLRAVGIEATVNADHSLPLFNSVASYAATCAAPSVGEPDLARFFLYMNGPKCVSSSFFLFSAANPLYSNGGPEKWHIMLEQVRPSPSHSHSVAARRDQKRFPCR